MALPTKEKWQAIGAGVEGKTPKECFARYKELSAKAREAKATK